MLDLDFCPVGDLLKGRKALRRELLAVTGLKDLRVAVLGGSTTNELVNLLEVLLLSGGFRPVFYQSEYGQYYEDAVHGVHALVDFKPDLAYIHTSYRNVQNVPPLQCTESDLGGYIRAETERYRQIWDALLGALGCQVIQNNFEMPPTAVLGNMDAVASGGTMRFFMELNLAFARESHERSNLVIQNVCGLSARMGLQNWFDPDRYFAYKILLKADAHLEMARSLSSLIRAMYGKSRKVLVLDLDNTLWGGVIGDDGVDKIQIGLETPVSEAYSEFQEYCLALRSRGILLAVCSKNTESVAKSGFDHPSSILKFEHFSSFRANWEPKHENILSIAQELSLGVDSFVFVDDNPAERAIVLAQLPSVAVPDVGSDVTRYPRILEQGRYFEPLTLSKEDLERAALYADNTKRMVQAQSFADYGEYLDSLDMVAEIECFKPAYLDRIAQLTNKTNQFNLTTRRYTLAEMELAKNDPNIIGLYGKLLDRFGDNGLISIVLGRKVGATLHMDLWLMSCRVLKRDMELAMLDALVERGLLQSIQTIRGYYFPTKKNGMVADFYERLGFSPYPDENNTLPDGGTAWSLDLSGYNKRNKHIKVGE